MKRRDFLSGAAAAAAAGFALSKPAFARKSGSSLLSHKERVDKALLGQDVDRPPYTFYRHYGRPTAQLEAQDHLELHRTYKTDIVKVMNDFDYPKSTSAKWYELKPLDSPYPKQLETLRHVRDGLNGDAYFIDTLYGPYMTAMILFQSQPQFANQPKSDEVETRADQEPARVSKAESGRVAQRAGCDHAIDDQPHPEEQRDRRVRRARERFQRGEQVRIRRGLSKIYPAL